MDGVSGTSGTGKTYRYYKCLKSPKKCSKKNVRKDFIEPLILDICRDLLSDEMIDKIVREVEELNRKDMESTAVIKLREEIKSTEKKIEVLLDQLEEGVNSSNIVKRLKKREDELEDLKKQLRKEQAKQRKIDPDIARTVLVSIRAGSRDDINHQKILVNTIIDRIYLYDDHFSIYLNHAGRKGKVSDREAADIEHYFDNIPNESSITLDSGTPKPHLSVRLFHLIVLSFEQQSYPLAVHRSILFRSFP